MKAGSLWSNINIQKLWFSREKANSFPPSGGKEYIDHHCDLHEPFWTVYTTHDHFPQEKYENGAYEWCTTWIHLCLSPSGWIQTDIFTEWFRHFLKNVKPTEDDPVVLVLDGNFTHEIETWNRNHPGRVVTVYQIAELFGKAYLRAATGEAATNGFRKAGLFPCNRNIFGSQDFPHPEISTEDNALQPDGSIMPGTSNQTSKKRHIAEISFIPELRTQQSSMRSQSDSTRLVTGHPRKKQLEDSQKRKEKTLDKPTCRGKYPLTKQASRQKRSLPESPSDSDTDSDVNYCGSDSEDVECRYCSVVMDVIKTEAEVDPLAIHWSDNTVTDEKKPLPEEGNLLDLHVAGIKTECVDDSNDLTLETKVEETAVPTEFVSMKCKDEEESCDVDTVEEDVMPRPFKCYECGNCFSDFGDFNIHVRVHTSENPLKCNICEKSFSSSSELNKHSQKHTDEKTLKCDICQKRFSRYSKLKSHARTHTGEKPFKCDECNKSFSKSHHLKQHARVHTREKPFKCDECHMSFTRSAHVKQHARVHTGVKPFQCDICEKSFTQYSHFKVHARIHNGEKPFKCDDCDMTFSRSDHFKQHARVHTGEKPFKCDECDMSFSRSDHLKQHSRVHTGEKPFKCDDCDASFSRSDNLKRHHLRHHVRMHRGDKQCKGDVSDQSFS
ncbi:hypothetical protein ANN_27552 [Periplaneta americana]|uniref:C2H2-type domain-containing protein n=1 Tax=Periplaneta americana TaxID=6978 RepID=A0ABQ8RW67_PERAM|nr:hypothetical protein ANN_27552 [Periplaneta americana]